LRGPSIKVPVIESDAAGEKAAVLVYHRIVDQPSERSFYDIPIANFERQMRIVAAHQAKTDREASPRIEITLDDGTADHRRAAEILTRLRLVGIFFIVTGRVGKPGNLSPSCVKALVSLGHSIGSHTVTHRKLPRLSARDLTSELENSREMLGQITGTAPEWFAAPGGYLDHRTFAAARAAGYRYVRTMNWGYARLSERKPSNQPISAIPVLPMTTDAQFARILVGTATFRAFRIKEGLKRALGETGYIALRNQWAALVRRQ
jgi:peptidoglycan/xylan/chitin deacetylase (PgdA/CDA1 family)